MENFAKIMILLELKGYDISPFIKLKQNELNVSGAKAFASDVTFRDLVKNENLLINPVNGYDNPFFSGLGVKKQATEIGNINIHNYKTNQNQSINSILMDEDLLDSQKQDIIYRGYQQLSNEYKAVLNDIAERDIAILKGFIKYQKPHSAYLSPKLLKKYNIRFWIGALLLIIFHWFLIKPSYENFPLFYRYLFNIVLDTLLFLPFIKIFSLIYLTSLLNTGQRKITNLKQAYDEIISINDHNIDKLEKDLYYYYSNLTKSRKIKYLEKTNLKLRKLRTKINKSMKKGLSVYLCKITCFTLRFLHIIIQVGFVLLIILYFIIEMGLL